MNRFLSSLSLALVILLTCGLTPLRAYEVWMGTHLSTSEMATNLSDWSMAASQLEGFNVNRAPHDTDPASTPEYRTIFAQFTNAQNTMREFARSQATRNPANVDELAFPSIAERLDEIFRIENNDGYNLTYIMFYDERGTYQGTEYLYEWTETEAEYIRTWLDANGQADVKLMWNVRNNGVRARQFAALPFVDAVEIEASTTAFLANTNNQRTFFDWFWTNPATAAKRIALQLPRVLPGDPLDQYQGTRRVAQSLAGTIGYGEDGMRSDRLIFLPVTYNDNFDYIPETVSGGTQYTNTLTSICLSLIEQRDFFEGRLARLPTVADADSTARILPPTISAIGDQVASVSTPTGAIPFTVADPETPLASLTVTAATSNTVLVPNSGIALGGADGNRTITITPSPGQMGTAEITVAVSDGIWSDSTTFTLTVGGLMVSQSADASVKENLAPTDQTKATTLLGAGGSSPWVDRCTVYVFQLPDLGAEADPFLSAGFSFHYEAKQGVLKNNDLYGLGRRDAPTVLGSDYYGKTATADSTDATRLQANVLTDATPLGVVSTSTGGDTALLDYLNAQYDSGAGIGNYVFLRLNTAAPKSGINRATLTMAEGGATGAIDTRPRIIYTAYSGEVITMVALGVPKDVTDGSTWSDGFPAHPGSAYIIPATGNLRSENGTSIFPGRSLTVQAGGKFQVRGKEESGELTTVDDLILSGGVSFAAGQFASLTAGTGTAVTNVLEGVITNSGHSQFVTYGTVGGNTIARNLRLQSRIDGSGRIQIFEGSATGLSSVFIDNAGNSFAGAWEVAPGSSLAFGNSGAVGSADIEVLAGGTLRIPGDWTTGATLTVADAAGTEVDFGSHAWTVSGLMLGGASIPMGTYDVADLNAFGSHAVFAGSGTLTVTLAGEGGPVARWALDEGTGTVASDSSGNGHAGSLLNGASWSSDATRESFVVFDGTDDRIATPFTYALASSDDFTWSWWANRTATGSSGAVMVGNRYPEGVPDERYEFIKFTLAEAQFANTENAASIDKYNYADVPQDGWHHYAMVKTGTSYQWYVDGVAQGSPVTRPYSEDSGIPFLIGGDDDGSGTKVNEHFEGAIDDVVLYDRALTPVELRHVRDGSYADLPATRLEEWRMVHFGTIGNTGSAADTADANGDGENNLLEFASGQDPHGDTRFDASLAVTGGGIEYRYTRSKAAVADGVVFQVEWSDSLLPESWDHSGVTELVEFETAETEDVVATIPDESVESCHARLVLFR